MNFELQSYLLGKTINQTYRLKEEFCHIDSVYLIGSGPSIDITDLKKIQHSRAIFLNAAVHFEERIDPNNKKYWLCQDYLRAAELIKGIPEHITKIVTVNRFKRLNQIRKHLTKTDIFCQPRLGFKKMNWGEDFNNTSFSLRPKIKLKEPFSHDPRESHITLLPDTVMLTAISIMIGFKVRNIYLLGFDAEPKRKDGISYSSAVQQKSHAGAGFDIRKIEAYLRALLEEAKKSNLTIKNLSPMTHEKALQKGHI